MGLESASFVSGLNASNPIGASDPKSQGDDHLRLIKSVLLATFPNANAAITSTVANLNGVTSASNLSSGTLPDGRFPATLPALNGSALTALNATQLTIGTVPDARFPATLPALNGSALTALNATQLTTGSIPNARVTAGNVTQHVASIDHNALSNYVANRHRLISAQSGGTPSGGADGDIILIY